MHLVLVLDRGRQIGPLIDEHIVAAAMRVAIEQECRLVDAVDDPVGGNVLGGAKYGRRKDLGFAVLKPKGR